MDWIPGVLSDRQVKDFISEGYVSNVSDPDTAVDFSSFDLTLSSEGYEMLQGSVKPFGQRYRSLVLGQSMLAKRLEPDPGGSYFTLKAKDTYVFKLNERIEALGDLKLYGQATAKSSIGRMDVLARLIVDGMDCYEEFTPEGIQTSTRDMYLEITPITFSVRVKEGVSLSQLRLFLGKPQISEIRGQELYESLLLGTENDRMKTELLSLDLSFARIGNHDVSAFCARQGAEPSEPIALWKSDNFSKPSPCNYWSFLKCDPESKRLKIEKTNFYILRSKERISLPKGIAAYCRAIDETIGEMRIHYAGFVHPYFGKNRSDGIEGTPLIFEVRGHDVDVSLMHGEKMAKLIFYRMSEDCHEEESEEKQQYNEQTLKLSTFFDEWPSQVAVAADGTVSSVSEEI
jgi:dCTP deaminase